MYISRDFSQDLETAMPLSVCSTSRPLTTQNVILWIKHELSYFLILFQLFMILFSDLPTAPLELRRLRSTSTSITVAWKAPAENGNRPINTYYLEIQNTGTFSRNGTNITTVGAFPKLEYTFNYLQPNVLYRVYVSAYNLVGKGVAAEQSYKAEYVAPGWFLFLVPSFLSIFPFHCYFFFIAISFSSLFPFHHHFFFITISFSFSILSLFLYHHCFFFSTFSFPLLFLCNCYLYSITISFWIFAWVSKSNFDINDILWNSKCL